MGRLMDDAGRNELVDELIRQGMGALNERMGIELLERRRSGSSPGCRWRATPSPTACCTAGASVVLAETLGSVGGDAARRCRAASPSVWTSTPPTTGRRVTAGSPARRPPCHLGRTLASYEVVITDEEGKRVCTSRITCLIRATSPGA